MAERTGKAKKLTRKAPVPSARGRPKAGAATDRASDLEAECRKLQTELSEAQARIEALETQRKQLVDRINWAIDSLQSLREE